MLSKGELEKLYWDRKLSTYKIASIVGVSQFTINRWLKVLNIPRRTPRDNPLPNPKGNKRAWSVITPTSNIKRSEALKGRFIDRNNSNYQPAKETKCAYCNKLLKVKGSNRRQQKNNYCDTFCMANAMKGKKPPNYLGEEAWIYPNCETCGKKLRRRRTETYKRYFCNQKCAGVWKSQNLVGGMIYNWKGGYEPYYGENWNYQRKLCRERDKNVCQKCRITAKEVGKNLDVDHKIPFEAFNGDWRNANKLENLQCLCPSCHSQKTNQQAKLGKLSIEKWKELVI